MANFTIPFDAGTENLYTFDPDKISLVGGNAETKNLGIKGITFDGIDDHVIVDHGPGLAIGEAGEDFAFSCLTIPVVSVGQAMLAKDDGAMQRQFQTAILPGGIGQIAYWKNGNQLVAQTTAAGVFSTGVLAHALFQKRLGVFEIYINGLLVGLGALTGTHGNMQSGVADLFIGAGGPGSVPFDGWISRSSIHAGSFSAAEALTFFQEVISLEIDQIDFKDQVAVWPMDDGDDGTSADLDIVTDPLNDNNNHGHGDNGPNDTGCTWETKFEAVRYDQGNPSIFKTLGDSDGVQMWTNFVVTLGGGNQGSAAHQLSVDGINWQFWNGSAWVAATTEFNTTATVNTNIPSFSTAEQKIWVKTFFLTDGPQKVEIDLIQIGFSTNQAPVIDAGTNKTAGDGETIAPFSDSSFSDPDGTVDKVFFKIVGEVDIFTEILIGGFGSLPEAVQAFQYQFNNTGIITAVLKVEDNEGRTSEDSLTVTVSGFTTNWTVKDPEGNHLPHVNFDPGSGVVLKDSPFTHDFDAGEHHVEVSKPGWIDVEIDINITGPGQSFFVVLDEFLGKSDIDEIASKVAQKVNRSSDIVVEIEDRDIEIEIDDPSEIIVEIEDSDIEVEIEDSDIEVEIEEKDMNILID